MHVCARPRLAMSYLCMASCKLTLIIVRVGAFTLSIPYPLSLDWFKAPHVEPDPDNGEVQEPTPQPAAGLEPAAAGSRQLDRQQPASDHRFPVDRHVPRRTRRLGNNPALSPQGNFPNLGPTTWASHCVGPRFSQVFGPRFWTFPCGEVAGLFR